MSARLLGRWLPPAVLLSVTAWVAWTNTSSPDTRIVFPFLRFLIGPDPEALAGGTLAILGTVSVVLVMGATRDTARWWRARQEEEEP